MQVDQTCANGHDLTVQHAFVFSASGLRSCRLCSEATSNRRKRPIKDIGSINRWSGGASIASAEGTRASASSPTT